MSKKEPNQEMPQIDPRLVQAIYGTYEEDEINLLAYWSVIWNKRKFIILTSFLVAVFVAGLTLMMPNIYKAEVLLAPVGTQPASKGPLSMLGSLGGLASLAGLSSGGTGSVEENIAVLKSREFIWAFVKDEGIMPLLFKDAWDSENNKWIAEDVESQPSLWDAWRLLIEKNVLSVSVDGESGLVKLSIEWKDPELAAKWVMMLVKRMNEHLRKNAIIQSSRKLEYLKRELNQTTIEENRQALFDLISAEQKQSMLANTQEDYAFRVIDPASVPDEKIKPKRSLIVIAALFVTGIMLVVYVLIQEILRKRKEELETVEDE